MQTVEKGYKTVNGIELYYEVFGAGATLLLIHGGGSYGFQDFEETIKRLYGSFRLITVDLQNHGRSGHRTIVQTFEQDAKDICALMDELGIAAASLFGFSNGATSVLLFASLFPEKTEKVIAASGVIKRSGMIDGFFEGMEQATLDHMPHYLKDSFIRLNPDPAKLQNMFEKDRQRMIRFEDWEDAMLRNITAPVFIIGGDDDVMKTTHLAEIHSLIPRSRLMLLPAGHGDYMMADEKGYVNEELVDFTLNRISDFLNPGS